MAFIIKQTKHVLKDVKLINLKIHGIRVVMIVMLIARIVFLHMSLLVLIAILLNIL